MSSSLHHSGSDSGFRLQPTLQPVAQSECRFVCGSVLLHSDLVVSTPLVISIVRAPVRPGVARHGASGAHFPRRSWPCNGFENLGGKCASEHNFTKHKKSGNFTTQNNSTPKMHWKSREAKNIIEIQTQSYVGDQWHPTKCQRGSAKSHKKHAHLQ